MPDTPGLCTCGVQPVQWQVTSDQVATGRARAGIVMAVIAILFGLLMLIGLVSWYLSGDDETVSPSVVLLLGLGSLAFGFKILSTRPARRQTVLCKSCGVSRTVVVPDERTKDKLNV